MKGKNASAMYMIGYRINCLIVSFNSSYNQFFELNNLRSISRENKKTLLSLVV